MSGIRLRRLPTIVLGIGSLFLLSSCGRGPESGGESAQTRIRFDVAAGFGAPIGGMGGGILRQNNWNPVMCEIFNPSDGFTGLVEITDSSPNTRQFVLDLPNNTLKRITIPHFMKDSFGRMSVGLYRHDPDSSGGKGALVDRKDLRNFEVVEWRSVLMGALADMRERTMFPEPQGSDARMANQYPRSVRIQPALFPDSAISLEGLSSLYLSSARALDLTPEQQTALISWLELGGHLILSVDNPTDVTATDWLRDLTPFRPESVGSIPARTAQEAFRSWLKDSREGVLPDATPSRYRGRGRQTQYDYSRLDDWKDADFEDDEEAPLSVVTGRTDGARVLLEAGEGIPLILSAAVKRGEVTVLAFNPGERPFRSWENRPWFWAKINRLSIDSFKERREYTSWNVDGILCSLVETGQIQKMPYEWLLLLLVVYLLVIGPVDYLVLKKLNRQMLTWITFPSYVILFSVLIYYIGYYLRAGVAEWNELHIVDVVEGDGSDTLRGRSWLGIYSPGNDDYPVSSSLPEVHLRPEIGGNEDQGKSRTRISGAGLEAELSVPIWINQFYVADWIHHGPSPFAARLKSREGGSRITLELENRGTGPIGDVHVVYRGQVYQGMNIRIGPGETVTRTFGSRGHISGYAQGEGYEEVMQSRQRELGRTHRLPGGVSKNASIASFISMVTSRSPIRSGRVPGTTGFRMSDSGFAYPSGMDLAALDNRNDMVVMAYYLDYSLVDPLNAFEVTRNSRHTLVRLSLSPDTPQ